MAEAARKAPVGPPSKTEIAKATSHNLRGAIAGELDSPEDKFSGESAGILKFHGLYQQEDRDIRRSSRQTGGAKHYMFMVRSKVPGGRLSAAQYLVHDQLATTYGNGSLRITTRQDFQMHGVLKGDLRKTLGTLNEQLITTLGACGDIARNVVTCPSPAAGRTALQLQEYAQQITAFCLPRGRFYHEIWIDGALVAPSEPEEEPLYGRAYLPRKFKTGIAYPGDNCIDVYAQDLGLVPEPLPEGGISGFTLLAGGGLGMTHHKKETFPRLADPIAFIRPGQLLPAVEAVIGIHRDFGDRSNRRHARLKYVLEEMGVAAFRAELEQRLGAPLESPGALVWSEAADHLGWEEQEPGVWSLGLPIENGRLMDSNASRLLTGLRELLLRFPYEVRLTTQQNLILCGIPEAERPDVEALLREFQIALPGEVPNLTLSALACPALPTCGLALAEAERVFPPLVRRLDAVLQQLGLGGEHITIRMTGCPNGCARPYTAEIGFVGKTAGVYDIYAGGDFFGTRLAQIIEPSVPYDQLVERLIPRLEAFRQERRTGERFGDFCMRTGVNPRAQISLVGA